VQDGFANGRLNDISIDDDGTIQGRYSNGQSQRMGQIILTNFANQEGLHQVNGTAWKESYNSGSALIGQRAGRDDRRPAQLPGKRSGHQHDRYNYTNRDKYASIADCANYVTKIFN